MLFPAFWLFYLHFTPMLWDFDSGSLFDYYFFSQEPETNPSYISSGDIICGCEGKNLFF